MYLRWIRCFRNVDWCLTSKSSTPTCGSSSSFLVKMLSVQILQGYFQLRLIYTVWWWWWWVDIYSVSHMILRCAVDQPNRWAFRCQVNVRGERVAVRRAAGMVGWCHKLGWRLPNTGFSSLLLEWYNWWWAIRIRKLFSSIQCQIGFDSVQPLSLHFC